MIRLRFPWAACALVLALHPAAAMAQAKCEIDEKKPNQVKDAASALARVALPIGKPEDKLKSLQQAVSLLNKEPEKIVAANAAGRAFVLGRAYALYIEQAMAAGRDSNMVVKRGALGLTTDPESTLDLVAAADSAFDVVEASNASCKDDTEEWRRRFYAPLINSAVNVFNQQQTDSAAALVRRGLAIYDGYKLAYIAYNILGNVLQSRDSLDGAVKSYQQMATLMKGDTAQAAERQNVMFNVAQLMMSIADTREDDKVARFKDAAAYLQSYRAEYPKEHKVMGPLARAFYGAGDSASAERIFKEILEGAAQYDDNVLFEAGVNASRAKRSDLALPFFAEGLKKNVASREGLFNYAVSLQNLDRWSEVPAIVTRLVAIDPANPDNYQLWALYYQNEAKARSAAAKKLRETMKKPPTPAEIKALTDAENLVKVASDSTIKYVERMQNLPATLSVNLFSHDGNKHVLGGSVENRTDAEKSYSVKFEFLNAAGAVVTSKDAVLEAVGAKKSKAFRVEVEGAGVVAYRYAPLSN